MALPAIAQLGIGLAPTAVGLLGNILGGNRQTPYEKRLSEMAKMFEYEATQPVTENRAFKSGMKIADKQDERNRRQINNQSAITGATDEAQIGMMGQANQARDQQIQGLLTRAERYRNLMQNRHLGLMGQMESARQARQQQHAQKMNSIVQPLGQASSAFLLSNALGNKPDPKPQPEGLQQGQWADGSSQLLFPNMFGGGSTADLIRNWGR